MANKKRKKTGTRRAVTRSRSTTVRSRSTRRRKKGLLGASMNELITNAKANGAAALGGGVYSFVELMKPSPIMRGIVGIGGAMMLGFFGFPFVGAGVAGACGHDLTLQVMKKTGLADGELEDVMYVDPSTLQDSGYVDSYGNALPMDDDGIIYELNDGGEYVAVGDAYSLQDGYTLQDTSSVQMLPTYLN